MFVSEVLHSRDPSSQIPFETWISAQSQHNSFADHSLGSVPSRLFLNGMFLSPLQSRLLAVPRRVGRRLSKWFNTRISILILFMSRAQVQIARSPFAAGELLFLNRTEAIDSDEVTMVKTLYSCRRAGLIDITCRTKWRPQL